MPTVKKPRKKSVEERRWQRQQRALEIFNRSVCAVYPSRPNRIVVSSGLACALAKGGKLASMDLPGYKNSKNQVAIGTYICRIIKDRKLWCVAVGQEPVN